MATRDRALVHRRATEVAEPEAEGSQGRAGASPSLIKLGRKLAPLTTTQEAVAARGPDWVEANPRRIERALARARKRPTGGWFVLGASRGLRRETRDGPSSRWVAGREWVLWRDGEELRVAPNACPHMGARLDASRCREGRLVCPWHGLELGSEGRGSWRCASLHDDGVLTWIQLPETGEAPTPGPRLPPRPALHLDAVIEMPAFCEPDDVIANRLDPWHGVHLHPYGFAELAMLSDEADGEEDRMLLRVAKRLLGPLCIEVDISFHCEDARTIVMTILDGEGRGSVVETHATPMWGPGQGPPEFADDPRPRTMIIEATLASSDRPGFAYAPRLAALFRPFMRRAARKLWVDDVMYAERLAELRAAGRPVLQRASS